MGRLPDSGNNRDEDGAFRTTEEELYARGIVCSQNNHAGVAFQDQIFCLPPQSNSFSVEHQPWQVTSHGFQVSEPIDAISIFNVPSGHLSDPPVSAEGFESFDSRPMNSIHQPNDRVYAPQLHVVDTSGKYLVCLCAVSDIERTPQAHHRNDNRSCYTPLRHRTQLLFETSPAALPATTGSEHRDLGTSSHRHDIHQRQCSPAFFSDERTLNTWYQLDDPILRQIASSLAGQEWYHQNEEEPPLNAQEELLGSQYFPGEKLRSRFDFFYDRDSRYRCYWTQGGERCPHETNRKDRARSHARWHLSYRPFQCKGRCGKHGWYVSPDLQLRWLLTCCRSNAIYTSSSFLSSHLSRKAAPTRQCPLWYVRRVLHKLSPDTSHQSVILSRPESESTQE